MRLLKWANPMEVRNNWQLARTIAIWTTVELAIILGVIMLADWWFIR
jgi:hypothetical protein